MFALQSQNKPIHHVTKFLHYMSTPVTIKIKNGTVRVSGPR
ncbi:MAG TPA: hypothetical protein VK168_22085 [Saprospiraceae bacterium]|nr:hypothetical protein [Saprospiraceae bacterium]